MQTKDHAVSLRTIFSEFPLAYSPTAIPDIPIAGLAIDSRKVAPGDLFIARRGGSVDGHIFIEKAVERGAAAVVGERDIPRVQVPYIQVADSIQAVTWLAAAFYDWPGRKMTVIGVTGTDGKTTTCNLLYQILIGVGFSAGLITTVNAVIGDEILDTGFHVTTPDAHEVQFYLSKMAAAGLTHAILETTSHGLAQHRVDASEYDIAIITNITHEHLDQHGTHENYRAVKGRLIKLLERTASKPWGNPRLAVLNHDEPSFEYLASVIRGLDSVNTISYGRHPEADIQASKIEHSSGGIHFDAIHMGEKFPVTSPLVGEFNVSNCLAALGAAVRGMGISLETAAKGISAMAGVPGRMENIDLGQQFTAIVDFAHTPNALRVAMIAAKRMLDSSLKDNQDGCKEKRVIAVFGSAGLRDKEKRRLMAETAAESADISILTAEDPRTESLEGILAEMADGARSRGGVEGRTFFCIPDRGAAIRYGASLATSGDILLVCGKGHEQSMCFGETEYPWDDRIALQAVLAELLGISGPRMPYLPTQESGNGKTDLS